MCPSLFMIFHSSVAEHDSYGINFQKVNVVTLYYVISLSGFYVCREGSNGQIVTLLFHSPKDSF